MPNKRSEGQVSLMIFMPEELKNAFWDECQRRDVSMTLVLRDFIEKFVEEGKEG